MFGIIIYTTCIITAAYIICRLVFPLNFNRCTTILLSVLTTVITMLFPLGWWGIDNSFFKLISSVSVGIVIFTLILTLLKDIIFILNKKHRNNILTNRVVAAVVLGSSIILTFIGYINSLDPKVVTINMEIKNLPIQLNGLKIVLISDLHVTRSTSKKWLKDVVERVNSLKPDIVALTGDIADLKINKYGYLISDLRDTRSKYGNYSVYGNHEYYDNDIEDWHPLMTDLGFTVLQNENKIIEHNGVQILLAGVTDPAAKHFKNEPPNIEKALRNDTITSLSILLTHQPLFVEEASKYGVDLQLSGHTHGGQFFPFIGIVKGVQKYFKGEYEYNGTKLYINQGTGSWGPQIRLGSTPEITEIILQ